MASLPPCDKILGKLWQLFSVDAASADFERNIAIRYVAVTRQSMQHRVKNALGVGGSIGTEDPDAMAAHYCHPLRRRSSFKTLITPTTIDAMPIVMHRAEFGPATIQPKPAPINPREMMYASIVLPMRQVPSVLRLTYNSIDLTGCSVVRPNRTPVVRYFWLATTQHKRHFSFILLSF
jgi:hypothetical protein